MKYNLSKREQEVLALLANQIVSAEDISDQLSISRNTVRIHLKNINTKVGTNSKSELLGRFIEFVIQNKAEQAASISADLLILISDDDESYVALVKKATHNSIGTQVTFRYVDNGQAMLEYLEESKKNLADFPRPNLIMLDLSMPKMNGFQALERLKTDPRLMDIPVVVFTSSSTKSDISNIYALGGNSYVTKPGGFQELKGVMQGIVSYWGQIGALPSR